MKLETNEPVAGEPEDGWQTAKPLVTTQVLELVLCRFTGNKVPIDNICTAMENGTHPDVDCRAMYYLGEALAIAAVAGAEYPDAQEEIRAPFPMGESIGTTHS